MSGPQSIPFDTGSKLAAGIRIEQAVSLVRTLPILFSCNIFLALLAAAAWRQIFSVEVLGFWLLAVGLVNAPTILHWLRFRNTPRPAAISPGWTRRATCYAIIIALPWAAAILAFPLSLDVVQRETVLLTVLIAGLTAGCVAALASTPNVCLSYFIVVLVPLIGRYLAVGDETHILIAASMTFYAVCLFYYVRVTYQRFVDGVRAKLENERLLVNLQETQSRLSDAIDRIPDGVALFDSDERMVQCNPAFRDHFERLGGGRIRPGVTFAEWLQIVVHSKAVTIQSGQEEAQIAIVLNWYRDSGAKDYVFASGHRILSASLQGVSGGGKLLTLSDVTALSASQAKPAEIEHRFQDIAESASDWFWEQDHKSRLTYVSTRFAEFTGCSESAALGQSYDQLPDGKSKPEIFAQYRTEVLAHRPFRDIRSWIKGSDGKMRCQSMSGKPIFSETGEFRGYRGSGREVTAEAEANEALLAAKIQAETANKAKSQFLANMSHELRTPLNAIIGFSELMQMQTFGPMGDARYTDYVSDIHNSGQHLLGIINDVLDMSRIEAGKRDLDEQEFDLSEVVENAFRIVANHKHQAGLDLVFEAQGAVPGLRAERRAVLQILLNLLSNAIKFTPIGGRITVSVSHHPDGAMSLAVSDTGIGIASNHIAKVLEPFGQVADVYTRGRGAQGWDCR